MKKVAIIGTQGVPAHYGGFESLAENLVYRRSKDVVYGVFCSSKDLPSKIKKLNGCRLWYIRIHSNGIQSILYDAYSMWNARKGFDSLLVLGVSGGTFLPILKRFTKAQIVVNIDGSEYKRAKWGKLARWFLRLSEKMAVRYADTVIADNQGIAEYVGREYPKYKNKVVQIAYGGDTPMPTLSDKRQKDILNMLDIPDAEYALAICRIEPENNVGMILETFSEMSNRQLVMVGNWDVSDYSETLRKKYANSKNITMIDAIYDRELLHSLRKNCSVYVHGHSAGGTNPSLVEMMFYGKPVLAYDVPFNHFTTDGNADFFSSKDDLKRLLAEHNDNGEALKKYAETVFLWKNIVKQYEELYSSFDKRENIFK